MPDEVRRLDDLDIEQDMRMQRRVWVAQRAGWTVMAAVVAAALMGVFGGTGPLNRRVVTAASGRWTVRHPPLGRMTAEVPMRVAFHGGARFNVARVWLSTSLLDGMNVTRVTPEATRRVARADGVTYEFERLGASDAAVVTFSLQPTRWGRATGQVGTRDGERVTVSIFSFP